MSFRDLRSFLEFLDSQGRLIRIHEEVEPKFGIARIERKYDGKTAILFERVKGFDIPVVANIFHSRQAVAEALGTNIRELSEKIIKAARNPSKVKQVKSGPVKEVIVNEVDLMSMFPIPMHFEKDAGYYITGGIIIAKDVETGVRNLSFARMWVKGRQKIGIMVNHYRHLMQLFEKAENKGKPLDVAIVIGVDPVTWLEGGMPDRIVPLEIDELEVANTLMNGGLEVVKAETVDVEIPTWAEIAIEGKMVPEVREFEGPFGDYSQVYDTPPRKNPIIKVTGITHRQNPIYLDCLPSSVENFLLGGIPREADLLDHVKKAVPNVNHVHLTIGSCCRFHAVVQMEKYFETDPYKAIIAMLSPSEASRDLKLVIVVDNDIDPFDPKDVEWAIATRTQWDLDLVILPKMVTALDPSAKWRTPPHIRDRGDIYTTKVGLV
ncbi:MAG: UbiD family decarboxylase [Thermodesulfobacteriota bacterium]